MIFGTVEQFLFSALLYSGTVEGPRISKHVCTAVPSCPFSTHFDFVFGESGPEGVVVRGGFLQSTQNVSVRVSHFHILHNKNNINKSNILIKPTSQSIIANKSIY